MSDSLKRGSGQTDRGHAPATLARSAAAEVVGTFFLIYTGTATAVAAATGASIAGAAPNSLAVAIAFGFALAAMVAAVGPVSGAHLNPAVSIGLAAIGRFRWRNVPVYIAAQFVGALLGAAATWLTLGSAARSKASLGATYPADGISDGRALLVEAFITFLLVFVIVAVTDSRTGASTASISIGFALIAAVLIGGPSTGGAVNPVRALGPMILNLDLNSFWVYILGPIVGGLAAALVYDRFVARDLEPSTNPDPD